jgi:DNA-binding CsgD family transcriptional regulator
MKELFHTLPVFFSVSKKNSIFAKKNYEINVSTTKIIHIMKIDPCIRKPWKIPKDLARLYSVEKVEKALSAFNRASKGNFYMVNYYAQKLILGTSNASTFCGYSKETIEKKGFDFYKLISKKNELQWLSQMNMEAYNVFFNYSESERQNLEFNYDLVAETINKQSVVLHHRLVPYKLCKNGNMWLGLCFVSISFPPSSCKASITNFETGEIYNFIDGKFVLSTVKDLTPDEIAILDYLAKDISAKQICEQLKTSDSTLARKKQDVFNKLGVRSSIAAVHKATKMEII